MMEPKEYADQFHRELFERVIPFWEKHSPDREHGGYFSCLLRDGTVYDTDKFIWLQARQVWTFATLYNQVAQKDEWLDMALLGARFLEQHGRAENGHWFFAVRQDGAPLVRPYNIFSDCFTTTAFSQLYKANGEDRYAAIARTTFDHILSRRGNPKGIYEKGIAASRPETGFSLPMILCNLCLELESLIDREVIERTIDECIDTVMHGFYDTDTGLVLETIRTDGTLSDSFNGRKLNPGHALEAMWFIMDLGQRRNDAALTQEAVRRALHMAEYGWDPEFGGFFYFMDRKGYPPQQLEWDQKLWWVHLEAQEAMLKGYAYTGDLSCASWFERIYQYTWERFPDPGYGEWFGYLHRDGTRLHEAKGGKWKGCFHVPRGLLHGWQLLSQMALDKPFGKKERND